MQVIRGKRVLKYNQLGQTGIRISCLGIGTATFGVAPLAEDADRLVGRAFDLGINLFDTANSYGNQKRFDRPGAPPAHARLSAEEILGGTLVHRRQNVVLCSKVMESVGPGPSDSGLSRMHIFSQIDKSLQRLRTDYIDIYYAHHPDPRTPVDETVGAMNDLIKQGKIRHYALSTFDAAEVTEVVRTCLRINALPPVCNQIEYSIASRDAELDTIPACQQFGLAIIAFGPLGGGLLAGRDVLSRPIIGDQRWGIEGFSERQLTLAQRFSAIADRRGIRPAPLALAWLAARPGVCSSVIGPENVEELEISGVAADLDLSQDLLLEIDSLASIEAKVQFQH